MPQPNKIPRPFADSGDKNSIPDSSGSIGFASWQEGFPAITSEPFAQGGVAPKRADFNGIFNALSAATVWNQQGGFYAYDATTDYEIGNIVEYSGDLYKCLVANGPSSAVKDPAQATYWARLYTSAGGTVTGQFVVEGTHNSISNYGMLLTGTNQNYGFALQDTGITKGSTFPLSTKYISQIFFGSAMGTYYDRMAHIREAIDSNGANRLEMVAFGLQSASDNTTCSISVNVDENDVPYTSAPTPTAGDNSTKIATTEFVNTRLPYENGTWTPILKGSTTEGSFTYDSTTAGYYVKIGKLVFFYVHVGTTAYSVHPAGRVRISGLPFAAANNQSAYAMVNAFGYSGGVNACVQKICGGLAPYNAAYIDLLAQSSDTPWQKSYAAFSSSSSTGYNLQFNSSAKTAQIYVAGCYEAAN